MNVGAESQIAGIWRRLRERKVAQWGIAYVAGAWGFLQGLGYVSDTFGWPGHIRQLVTLALLIGLPLLLVLAWYHGDRGQQRVSGAELTIITLLFLLGGGIFWQYARDNVIGHSCRRRRRGETHGHCHRCVRRRAALRGHEPEQGPGILCRWTR